MGVIPHYNKIFSIGDPILEPLFNGEVLIEEKVDGSQFRVFIDENNIVHYGSKGVEYNDEHPIDKMFLPAIQSFEKHYALLENPLTNYFLIFEYLKSPKHNSLTYARTPNDYLVLLDVRHGSRFLTHKEKEFVARCLGLECIPLLKYGIVGSVDDIKQLLEMDSFLGNVKIEGIVIKNYNQIIVLAGKTGPCMGKYVREEFKELNKREWNVGVPMEERIMENFPLEARWEKVIQHLRESGELQGGVKDIGKCITIIGDDFEEECKRVVQEMLWKEYVHALRKMTARGFPEWFKKKLLEESFKDGK